MTRVLLALLAALALSLAACGGDEGGEVVPADPPPVVPDPETVPEEPEGEPTEPIGEPGTEAVATEDFPSLAGDVAYLVDVRAAGHDETPEYEGFDRIVLEFDGADEPSWRVAPLDGPVTADGSGEPVDVQGDAFIELRLTPATGVDLVGEEPRVTYPGPDRVPVDGAVALEVVRVGDFEATLSWVIGLERPAPFAAAFLEDPLRLVVDVFRE